MRKGHKPIADDLREQVATLVEKNGICHVSRESGRGNSTLYRLIRGESHSISAKHEQALRKYIKKFRNGSSHKPAKGKRANTSSRKAKEATSLGASAPPPEQDEDVTSNGEKTLVLAFQLALSSDQVSQLLRECHNQNCSPEAWLTGLVEERL